MLEDETGTGPRYIAPTRAKQKGPRACRRCSRRQRKNNSEINTHFIERKIGIPAYKMKSSKMKNNNYEKSRQAG